MQSSKLRFTVNETVKFSKSSILSNNGTSSCIQIPPTTKAISKDYDEESDTFGGIIFNGQLAWMANGSQIEVVSLKNGYKVSSYTFNNSLFTNTQITYVTEISVVGYQKICILAICVQCSPALTGGSLLCLFAVHGSRLLRCIEFDDRITSCTYINSMTCSQNRLMQFDGAIVIGTNHGKLLLCDLKLKELRNVLCGKTIGNNELQIRSSCIIVADANFNEIEANHERSAKENGHFCIQFEDSQLGGQIAPILSLLILEPLFTIAAGLADGRLIFYDLCDLVPFHVAHPPENDSPLLKLSFMEPSDDPRACCFVWAFHVCANSQAVAVMHSLMFERKIMNNEQDYIYKNFQTCSPRLTLRIPDQTAFPLVCQSISKPIPDEESFLSLCMLAWSSTPSSYACIFDLNQWYKEQMPSHCELIDNPSYLVYFPLNVAGRSNNNNNTTRNALDIWINANTVTPFNSIHRPEEHFYPSSLNFDCTLLTCRNAERLHWSGLQNEILKTFSCSGSNAILDPNQCFDEMICASLIPQFTDYSQNVCLTTKQKQDFLLSIALEYNCVGLLKECAKVWANGSHLGRQPNEGLSLFTLTDWICDRATLIKNRCNNLCNSLFDHSGSTIDYRARMTLSHYSRQLKILSELLQMIITTCHQFIPSNALDTLQSKRNSIQMVAEYQEILQWLLNMGLLPEGVWNNDTTGNNLINEYSSLSTSTIVPYPYRILRNYYMAQRRKFCEINRSLISTKTKSCRLLYIDAFIEKECNSALLRNEWKLGCMSDGLYPPPSLQCMLRTLLVPGVSIENKYMLFVYMFLDLNMVLNDERYAAVVQNLIKFPAVFKLDPALIKTTQAFWNLDHCEFETAVDELISPLSQDHHIFKWQHELLIESLLVQDVSHLALRALRSLRPPISPSLEMKTLLVNNLVSEAFQLQRTRADPGLLQEFFHDCHKYNRWSAVLDLSLSTDEEQALCKYLRANPTQLNSNLHFLYLLQRNKYTEANTLVEQIRQSGSGKLSSNTTGSMLKRQGMTLDTPSTILSAYKITMTPAIRHLSQLYHSVKDSINTKLNKAYESPMPLSCNLLQSSNTTKNIFSNIYHQTVLCTEQTTESYWHKQRQQKCSLTDDDVPFLRAPNYSEIFSGTSSTTTTTKNCIIEPTIYVANKKRRMDNDLECDERGNDIRELDDGPRKRMRIESINDRNRINASLLTSFRDSSGITKSTPIKKRVTEKVPAINEDDDDISMVSVQQDALLSTPIVKSLQQQQKESALTAGSNAAAIAAAATERSSTPHSILKVKGVESSSASTCSRSYSPFLYTNASSIVGDNVATEADEKSIRFNLPQSPDIISSTDVTAEENVSTTPSTKRNTSYLGATTRSAIRSSCDISASSNSCDEFYSPNTTQNNVDENDDDHDQDGNNEDDRQQVVTETIAAIDCSHNQPEIRGKTPEIVNFPQGRRSYRSRSRTPEQSQDHVIPVEINERPPNERRTTKSLSRMVLEANAIKSVSGNEMVAEISKHRNFLNETADSLSTIGSNQSLEQSYDSMIQGRSTRNWLVDSDANEIDVDSTATDQDVVPVTEEICVEKLCFVTTDDKDPSGMDKKESEHTANSVDAMEVEVEEEPPNDDERTEAMPVVEEVCVKKFHYVTTADEQTDENRPFQNQPLANLQSSTPKDIPSNMCQLKSDSYKLIANETISTSNTYKRRNLFSETADDTGPKNFDQTATTSDFNDTSMMEIMTKFGPKNYLTDDTPFTALEMSSLAEGENVEPQMGVTDDDEKQMINLLSSSESEDDEDDDDDIEEVDDDEDEDHDDDDVQDVDDYEDEYQLEDEIEVDEEVEKDVQDDYEDDDQLEMEDEIEVDEEAEDVDDVGEEESSESDEESTSNEENSSDENKVDDDEIVNISSDSDEQELEVNDQKEESGEMVQIESNQSGSEVPLPDPISDDKLETKKEGSGSLVSSQFEAQVDNIQTFVGEIVQSELNDELMTEVEESVIPDSSLLIHLSKKPDEVTSNKILTTVPDVEVGLIHAVNSSNADDQVAPQPTSGSNVVIEVATIASSSQDPTNPIVTTVPEVDIKIDAIDNADDEMVTQPPTSVEMEVVTIPDSSQQPIDMTSNKIVSTVPEVEFKIDSTTTIPSVEVASIPDSSLPIPSSQEQIEITANEIVTTAPEVEVKIVFNNADNQMQPHPSTFSSAETNIELPVNVFEYSADNDEFQQSLLMEDDDSLDYASAEQSHATDDKMESTSNLHNVCLMLDDNISVPEISTTSHLVSDDQENPLPADSVNEATISDAAEPSTSFNTADDMSSYQKFSESNFTIAPADQCQIVTKMFDDESFKTVDDSVSNLPDNIAKTDDKSLQAAEESPEDQDHKNSSLESDLQTSPAKKHFANESEPTGKNAAATETKISETSSVKSEIIISNKRQTRSRSQSINIEEQKPFTNELNSSNSAVIKRITRRGNSEPPQDLEDSTMALETKKTSSNRLTTFKTDEHQTPTRRRSRASSVLSDTTDSPARHTRSAKLELDQPISSTPTKRKTSAQTTNDDDEDAVSVVSARSSRSKKSIASGSSSVTSKTNKKQIDKILVNLQPIDEEKHEDTSYADSRRMTRSQKSMFAKMGMSEPLASASSLKRKFDEISSQNIDEQNLSDTETVASKDSRISKTSSSTTTKQRGRPRKKTTEDDAESIASSTGTSKTTRSRAKKEMPTIDESDESSKKRTRKASTSSSKK